MRLPPRDHRLDTNGAPSLLELVARAARRLSDGALVLCAAAGLSAAALVLIARPAYWPAALPALTMASLGGWGIADRAISDARDRPAGAPSGGLRLLRALRFAVGVAGVAAFVGSLLALAMRTVITTGSGWF